jgi:hypothetical protein
MPLSDECVILFCEIPALSSRANPRDNLALGRDVRKSVLLTLQQNIGNPVESESCEMNGLIERIRRLKGASVKPIVVLLAQSPESISSEAARQIKECASEIGGQRIFLAIENITGNRNDRSYSSLIDSAESIHRYTFPDVNDSLSSEIEFWRVINDLAVDIARAIKGENKNAASQSIFLAPVPDPIEPIARKLRHELESRGFDIRSNTSFESTDEIEALLSRSALSVHLFGGGTVEPTDRGSRHSMDVFRCALAYARAHPEFRILGWTDAQSSDANTDSIIGDRILRESKEFNHFTEVVQSTIEDFKSLLYDRLGLSISASATPDLAVSDKQTQQTSEGAQLYIIYDPRDAEAAKPVTNFLQHQGVQVILSEYPAGQSDLRAIHHENLRRCDGALIVYGAVQEQWVRMKQQDLLRASALGRKKSLSAKGVFLCSNKTEGKMRFSAPDMMIINGFDSVDDRSSTAALAPFIQRLSAK